MKKIIKNLTTKMVAGLLFSGLFFTSGMSMKNKKRKRDNNNETPTIIEDKKFIELIIYPNSIYPIKCPKRPTCSCLHATLCGDFSENQIMFRGENNENDQFVPACGTYSNIKEYTLKNISEALKNKTLHEFPLFWLKKLNGPIPLKIVIHNTIKDQFFFMDIPEKELTGIGKELAVNADDKKRCCFNFFKQVYYADSDQSSKQNLAENNLQKGCIEKLAPGDWIVLFSQGIDKPPKNEHYAMYLGKESKHNKEIFLSKCGNGGPLVVSTLEEMLTFWKSKDFFHVPYKQEHVKVE